MKKHTNNMMEIGKQGNVSEDAIIDYIISDIQDSKINKILLYGATPISEFKVKLQLLTKMKFKMNMVEYRISRISQNTNNSKISSIQRNITSNASGVIVQRYNCWSKIHQQRKCPDYANYNKITF